MIHLSTAMHFTVSSSPSGLVQLLRISSRFMGGQSQSCDLEIRLRLIGDYLSVAFIASFYGATVDNVKVSSSQTSNLKSLRY